MNILVLNSSLHEDKSTTKAMVAAYLDGMGDRRATVAEHDLAADPIPHLTPAAAAAIRGESDADESELRDSDALIEELERADVIVLGVPMYNFTIPSNLKTWIDHVVRARRTFSYEGGQPHGLLDPGKEVVLFLSSDGVYTSGPAAPMDFVEPYLRTVLWFIGLTNVAVVRAEGQVVPDLAEANSSDAIEAARRLAEQLGVEETAA